MMMFKRALLLALLPGTVLAAPIFTLQSSDFNDSAMLDKTFQATTKVTRHAPATMYLPL